MMKYLIPSIAKYGYKERGKSSDFEIVRKAPNGTDIILGGIDDYGSEQQIVYGVGKSDNRITDILKSLEKSTRLLSPPISSKSLTISFSYSTLNGLNNPVYLPDMKDEGDIEKNARLIVEFLETKAQPLLEKFNDLREIDKIINGDAPWESDSNMPFRFSSYFNFIRLIVARLAGNEKFDFLVDFTYSKIEKDLIEQGNPLVIDRTNITKPLPGLIEILSKKAPIY